MVMGNNRTIQTFIQGNGQQLGKLLYTVNMNLLFPKTMYRI